MEKKTILLFREFVIGILLMLLVVAYFMNKKKEQPITQYKKPLLQSSAYELKGCLDETIFKILCYSNGINYKNSWYLSCPRAPNLTPFGDNLHAKFIYLGNDTFQMCYFYFDCLSEPMTRIYCSKCYYPLGTDWIVKKR